jgi:hypothetical protein
MATGFLMEPAAFTMIQTLTKSADTDSGKKDLS